MPAGRYMWNARRQCLVPSDGQLILVSRGGLPVSLSDALFHLRIDAGTEDDLVTSLIKSIQEELEPPNGWLGRALTTASYKQLYPGFADHMYLSGAPVQSVDAISYRDSDGNSQTVSTDVYRLTEGASPQIVLKPNQEWPADVECAPDAVSIEYTAGFGDEADVPEIIKQYIRIMVGYRYDVRKPAIVGTNVTPTPYVRDMLESLRVRL